MPETESEKLDLAVECFKSGMSLADSASRYNLTLASLEAEVERRAKAKRSEALNAVATADKKHEFVYESAQMEDAVNSVLCGMSIRDAASAYGVSKNALKQALREELDKEPQEEGSLVAEEMLSGDPNVPSELYRASPLPDALNPFEDISGLGGSGGNGAGEDAKPATNVLVIEPQPASLSGYNWGKPSNLRSDGLNLNKMSLTPKEDLGDEIPVHCGEFSGVLHRKRFLCPGLRSECIQLPDGRWVTPKTFSIIGGKASLKNWKNAVRIHNVSLRHYMDAGYVDFYEHETDCSGKCSHKSGGSLGKYQSRINSMRMKTAQDLITQEALNAATGGGRNSPHPTPPLPTIINEKVSEKLPVRPTTVTDHEPPALLPFMENVTSSPAFTVLRQAQQGDRSSNSGGSQPVFPSPTPMVPGGTPRESASNDDVTVTSVIPGMRKQQQPINLLPANLAQLNQQIANAKRQTFGGTASNMSPQTIIVRPIRQGDTTSSPAAANKTVTYLVPTNCNVSGAKTIKLPSSTLMIPVSGASGGANQQQTAAQPPVAVSPSSFPNIDNIMKDSMHFWKGIMELGLLDQVIHDMKVQLSCVKRRAYNPSGIISQEDARALSKVASALWLQSSIRHKLSEKQEDMKRQNDRIQSEIDELRRKMEDHERRQQELKRKSEAFDELLTKRPCLNLDSDDDDDGSENFDTTSGQEEKSDAPTANSDGKSAVMQDGTSATEYTFKPRPTTTPVPETVVQIENNEIKDNDKVLEEAMDTSETQPVGGVSVRRTRSMDRRESVKKVDNVSVPVSTKPGVKSGRSSRKSAAPMKKPATPTFIDNDMDDQAINGNRFSDDDDDDDNSLVDSIQNGHENGSVISESVQSKSKIVDGNSATDQSTAQDIDETETYGDLVIDDNERATETESGGENETEESETENVENGSGDTTKIKVKPSSSGIKLVFKSSSAKNSAKT